MEVSEQTLQPVKATKRVPAKQADTQGGAAGNEQQNLSTVPDSATTSPILRVWLWALAVIVIICIASSNKVSAPFVPDVGLVPADKLAHTAIFGLIATLIYRALPANWGANRRSLFAIVAVFFFGVIDEVHQSFTPGRSADVYDLLADTCGAIIAVASYRWFHLYRRILEWPIITLKKKQTELRQANNMPEGQQA